MKQLVMFGKKRETETPRRWICGRRSCRAVHHYPAQKCQRCGRATVIEESRLRRIESEG